MTNLKEHNVFNKECVERVIKSSKNFVFTSFGDHSTFDKNWIGESMQFDIYAIYYGDNEAVYNTYKDNKNVKFIEKRKGSKFQNFKYFYDNYPDIIKQYEYFFILDDDIIFDAKSINKMFFFAKQFGLLICGPSLCTSGTRSHPGTRNDPNVSLTYTNFVEVHTPLFSKEALYIFMQFLDSSLIGWGIDYLYIWCNGIDKQNSYAIIHDVICINPLVRDNGERELTLVDKWDIRKHIWQEYAKKINCPVKFSTKKYSSIKAKFNDKPST